MSKVLRFGGETVDLENRLEPILHQSFRSLMDEEEPHTPHFTFARVHSRNGGEEYRHLYSARSIVEWYPLKGRTDPCTRGDIDRIEYFLYMKGEGDAIHVGNVYGECNEKNPVSKSADYLIWSLTAADEPSKMMGLMAIAFLQHLGLDSVTAEDTFDTSNMLLNLRSQSDKDLGRKEFQRSNGRKLLRYVRARVSKLAESGEIKCSDPETLLTSMAQDASRHVADVLVSQDPNVDEDNDDFARVPHTRGNALAVAIMKRFIFDDESGVIRGPGTVASAGSAGDPQRVRRRSI